MLYVTTRLRLVVAALFGVYLFLYPFSITLVALDRVPMWGTWMGGALLILQGAIAGLWLTVNFGGRGAAAALWVLLLSWLVEHVGATTGFPFGAYSYTDVLQPQLPGGVPLAISFAWLLIVTAAVGTSELAMGRDGPTAYAERRVSVTKILTASSFALLLDVTIEPFAVHINRYWVWSESANGSYYGIPASNFVAWFCTSLILSWVVLLYRARAAAARPTLLLRPFWPWLPVTLYVANLTMFVVVNMARGHEDASVIGGLILLALACNWMLPRLARRMSGAEQEPGAQETVP